MLKINIILNYHYIMKILTFEHLKGNSRCEWKNIISRNKWIKLQTMIIYSFKRRGDWDIRNN